jgi:hypothetical protein
MHWAVQNGPHFADPTHENIVTLPITITAKFATRPMHWHTKVLLATVFDNGMQVEMSI